MDLVVIQIKCPFSCKCGCLKTLDFPHHSSGACTQETLTQYPSYKVSVELDPWMQLTNSCMNFRLNELMWCLMSELETWTDPGVSVEISFPGLQKQFWVTETRVYHMWCEIFLKWNFKWYHWKTRDKHSITLIQEVQEEALWEMLTISVEEK